MEFLEELLDRHEIADEEVEFSMEWMAKEYNKQDGKLIFIKRSHASHPYQTRR